MATHSSVLPWRIPGTGSLGGCRLWGRTRLKRLSSSSSKCYLCTKTSPVAQLVKNLPAMHETRVKSLDLEDPLEKGMASHSSTLAWKIPWTDRGDWQATVHGVTKS